MVVLEKKTFEISNLLSADEINALSLALNEHEQVSHMKINKDSIVFNCIDIHALSDDISKIKKDVVINEVVDGKKREFDFARVQETKHYFMFKNLLTEEDIELFLKRIQEDKKYKDVQYDQANKVLTLTTSRRDVISYLRNTLAKINPSIEIIEHHKPIRSQDVFNQKYLYMYLRIAILLVLLALAFITSKDHTIMTPVLWFIAMLVLAERIIKKVIGHFKQKQFFKEDVLVLLGCVFGIVSQAYVETCIAVVLYQAVVPILDKVLERSLNKIDRPVTLPEKGKREENGEIVETSLYDFQVGDTMVVGSGETVMIPGTVMEGESLISTYSSTSTYELLEARKGIHLKSGYVNVGKENLYVQIDETYESSNYIELMNIASQAPVYESKVEHLTKKLSQFYTPVMFVIALIMCVVLPIIDFEQYSRFIHVGAVFLILSGALSSEQSTSLGMLAGFAKAFENGIIVESSKGLDAINGAATIVYDRFDGVEVTNEELELFRKLSHMGRVLVIFNDGPVALENDQYTIYNDLTIEEKLEKMDSFIGPVVYIGDSFKDIQLLQKSYVGISRGGLANSKVVESSDIVLIDSDLNKVFETFLIARKMRTIAVFNNIFTIVMKLIVIFAALSFNALPLWVAVIAEMLVSVIVMSNSTHILE